MSFCFKKLVQNNYLITLNGQSCPSDNTNTVEEQYVRYDHKEKKWQN